MFADSNMEDGSSAPRGVRDHWRNGMHVPHARLGWFPLSVKGGIIRYWTLAAPKDYYRYLREGFHSDYEFEQAIGSLPCRMHLCLICNSIFDATFKTTVSHCDSTTHRNRLTDVLDLDAPLASGLTAPSSPEDDLAAQLSSIGINSSSSCYHDIPAARGEGSSSSSSSPSPSTSTASSSSSPSIDIASLFSTSLRISNAREAEYDSLLRAMGSMGLA
ncbi:hypothetical protein BC835DRAFT_1423046 [Cytidiella melzeri]|nr:hypothetical protein BC835DRAFT_1423046 [Cytidiella melzeri]